MVLVGGSVKSDKASRHDTVDDTTIVAGVLKPFKASAGSAHATCIAKKVVSADSLKMEGSEKRRGVR